MWVTNIARQVNGVFLKFKLIKKNNLLYHERFPSNVGIIFFSVFFLISIGIWLHHNGVLGSSPDGIIRRAAAFGFHHQSPALTDIMQAYNIQPEILEVKCPYSAKDKTIAEAVETIADFCLGKQAIL